MSEHKLNAKELNELIIKLADKFLEEILTEAKNISGTITNRNAWLFQARIVNCMACSTYQFCAKDPEEILGEES